jgi:hypothetical protein
MSAARKATRTISRTSPARTWRSRSDGLSAPVKSPMVITSYVVQFALELASFGLKVLPVHSVDPAGQCSCGCSKPNCGSRGKHPRILDWQHQASSDENVVCEWWERWPMSNIGVQWGPRSNAIDVEFDSEEGRAAADKYLGGIITPSYQSRRSVHRVFRYVDALSGFGVTKKGEAVEYLEYRIGADNRGAQSVVPPSRHHSGCLYSWLPGLSIAEVEIAPPPPALVALILQSRTQSQRGIDEKKPAAPIADNIPHGERHLALVSLAGTMRRRGLVKEEIIPSLRAVVERRCEYVAGDEIDIEAIAESICRYQPNDPLLKQQAKLTEVARDQQLAGLHPAIRRARLHAIQHRAKSRRTKP